MEIIIREGITETRFSWKGGVSSATVAKMGKGEPVSNKVLEKICNFLECSVNDIISCK